MRSLLRAQVSAGVATLFDLAATVALTSSAVLPGAAAGTTGSMVGGVINFTLNRRWAYDANPDAHTRQALRYAQVWCGHVALSYGLLHVGIDVFGWHYIPVKLAVMALLAVCLNHLLHRHYVFSQ